jgi:hypothetical protein
MLPEIRSHTDGNKDEDCNEVSSQEDEDDGDSLHEEANCYKEVGGQEDHRQEDNYYEGNCQAVPEEEDCHKESDSQEDYRQKGDGKAIS